MLDAPELQVEGRIQFEHPAGPNHDYWLSLGANFS